MLIPLIVALFFACIAFGYFVIEECDDPSEAFLQSLMVFGIIFVISIPINFALSGGSQKPKESKVVGGVDYSEYEFVETKVEVIEVDTSVNKHDNDKTEPYVWIRGNQLIIDNIPLEFDIENSRALWMWDSVSVNSRGDSLKHYSKKIIILEKEKK